MSSVTYYVSLQELKKRLAAFPIKLEIPDPVSGAPIVFDRENVFVQCFVKADQLIVDAQTIPALYMEAARMQRACIRAAAQAESAYTRWKAGKFIAAKKMGKGEKDATDKAAEAAYRQDDEYESMSSAGPYFRNVADLMDDLKQALKIKSYQIEVVRASMAGYEGASRVASHEEAEDMDDLDDMVAKSIEESRKALAKPRLVPPPPVEDDEDEDEDEEEEVVAPPKAKKGKKAAPVEEEEDEDEEEEDVPPPPSKRGRKAAPVEEEEEDEDEEEADEDEEDEEEPPPPPARRRAAASPVEEEDDADEEDEEEDDEDEEEEDAPPPRRRAPRQVKGKAQKGKK